MDCSLWKSDLPSMEDPIDQGGRRVGSTLTTRSIEMDDAMDRESGRVSSRLTTTLTKRANTPAKGVSPDRGRRWSGWTSTGDGSEVDSRVLFCRERSRRQRATDEASHGRRWDPTSVKNGRVRCADGIAVDRRAVGSRATTGWVSREDRSYEVTRQRASQGGTEWRRGPCYSRGSPVRRRSRDSASS